MCNSPKAIWKNDKCNDACYYSKNANFKTLFDELKISKKPSYLEHLNKHNVIYITFNSSASDCNKYSEYIEFYKNRLVRDIKQIYPNVNSDDTISEMLKQAYEETGKGFIFILDEWDYIFNNNLFELKDREKFTKR